MDPKTRFWKFMFLGKVILHMSIKFEHDRMKNEWEVRKKGQFFGKYFLEIYIFGQGHFAYAYKIWAWSDEKWMSSSWKRSFFSDFFLFLDPKTHFWKCTFLG